ncbi:hypothetical protein J7E73_10005 [Paenibacillus albidus]|uniref:hypothetical protein n=1 Tax=Paenibacillus albidus TaxID=2041023 RepID=UPI001BE6386D|nr:hypothetical protein [Paenibacillus albidus]MBT2289457.1 hypothetical protein [Paenibacillus albidus]
MPENQHEILDIIQFARELKIDIEILELVWTDYNRPCYKDKRLSTNDLASELVRQGGNEQLSSSGIGVNLMVVDFENSSVRLMDNSPYLQKEGDLESFIPLWVGAFMKGEPMLDIFLEESVF